MGKQIIVLGMHRSGTSVITHLIHSMGAYFGEIDQEMRPSADNPKGFWERMDIVEINDAILKHADANWFKVSGFKLEEVSIPGGLKEKVKSTIASLQDKDPWVVKDPRYSLTLPIWDDFLKHSILVFPFRSPLEVAKSLQKRNNFPIEYSLALWQEYVVSAIKHAQDRPVIFVEYEKLVNAPIEETKKLHNALIEHGVANLTSPSDPLIKDIIDPTLKHATVSQEKEKDQLNADQLALIEGLRSGNMEALKKLVHSINGSINRQFLKVWEPKITELVERTVSKNNRITSTLYSSDNGQFSLNNAVRITQETTESSRTFKFFIDSTFQLGRNFRLDLVNDLSIFQLNSILLSGNPNIQIDINQITSNAFYRIGNYFFFDEVPSSIYFSLPETEEHIVNTSEILVDMELLGKGISILPHVNQFHKNFKAYGEDNGEKSPEEIEALILTLTQNKERAFRKVLLQIEKLESNNHKLTQNINSLHDQNRNQLEIINKLTTNFEGKNQEAEKLTTHIIKLSEDIKQEKESYLKLKEKFESILSDKKELKIELGRLESEKEAQIRELKSEMAKLEDEKEAQIGELKNEMVKLEAEKEAQIWALKNEIANLETKKEVQIRELKSEMARLESEKEAQIERLEHEIANLLRDRDSLVSHFENEVTNLKGSLSYQVGMVITYPIRIIFDILTKKKPFNQTRLWWFKQYLLHPKAFLGSQEERKRLKNDWLNQREITADLLKIEQEVIVDKIVEKTPAIIPPPPSQEKETKKSSTEKGNHPFYRQKVLYISPNLPDYDTSSGGKRATRMLGLLAEEFDVYAFTLGSKPQKYIDELQKNGVIVIRTSDHREVRRKLPHIDAIIYAWYDTYFTSRAFRQLYPDAKIILDSVDVHWVREKRSIGIWEGLTEERVATNQRREMEAYRNADVVWAVTETDKNAILLEIPNADVRVVSNIHEPVLSKFSDNQKNTLLFIGGYNHYPNVSAVNILAKEILPEVRKYIPDAQLIIAGANAPGEVEALAQLEGVVFKGFIEEEEIEDLYNQSFLTVSPLLAGAGIKGKICESIAYMTPVVTNDIGNEGINLIHEEEGLISTIEAMPGVIVKALKRTYDFEDMTKKAQTKLFGLVGSAVVKERMVNSVVPEVSICIVTWNRKDLVKRCIESIEGNTLYPNYKILVHSNGCTDGTQNYLEAAAKINPRIVPILSKDNDVFVLPNNWMMEKFPENDVVLINNDVYVTKGWLTAMHETAYSSADYGIVGSKTLYPDGRLQEFGSELYANGTGRNIGKFDDPNKEEYKKLSEVGYVSGCSMYIKRSTIKAIGVFDEQFHPCYCEDSDYCYTAKEHGIKTVVTPKSVIFHDEGGTSGTDTSSGMKRYQVVNMEKFLKKHVGKDNGIIWSKEDKNKISEQIKI